MHTLLVHLQIQRETAEKRSVTELTWPIAKYLSPRVCWSGKHHHQILGKQCSKKTEYRHRLLFRLLYISRRICFKANPFLCYFEQKQSLLKVCIIRASPIHSHILHITHKQSSNEMLSTETEWAGFGKQGAIVYWLDSLARFLNPGTF